MVGNGHKRYHQRVLYFELYGAKLRKSVEYFNILPRNILYKCRSMRQNLQPHPRTSLVLWDLLEFGWRALNLIAL